MATAGLAMDPVGVAMIAPSSQRPTAKGPVILLVLRRLQNTTIISPNVDSASLTTAAAFGSSPVGGLGGTANMRSTKTAPAVPPRICAATYQVVHSRPRCPAPH